VSEPLPLGEAAARLSLTPLWEIYHRLMVFEPAAACAPAHWRYADVRLLLSRAGREVSTDDAERRVFLFRNPGLERPFATHTLGCGLQLLLGGEVEGAHRHTPGAIRFVVEGDGAYTTTAGERIWMSPGDLITTPSWTWHDHGKTTDGEMIWLDGIDVPLINHLGLNFTDYAEGDRQQALIVPDGHSHWRYGQAMMPLGAAPAGISSPVFHYPYAQAREVLAHLAAGTPAHPVHGYKMRYANPATGGHITATIGAFLQRLPARFAGALYRQTDAAIYHVVEGSGAAIVGDQRFDFSRHDVFVVPNWVWHHFASEEGAILFSYSDRAMQEALGLWRDDASRVPEGR
jgi:gentisate 1,2-dioxygenase